MSDVAAEIKVGDTAPDFNLKDQDQKDVKLSDYRGKKNVVLAFYPRLRSLLDVQYVAFPRPRAAVIAAIGAENQGLPSLVIGSDPAADKALAGLDVREAQGRRFLQSPGDIGRYLSRRHGIGEPH